MDFVAGLDHPMFVVTAAALFGARTGDEVDKFTRCRWTSGPAGVPLLDDCPRRLVGEVLDRFDLGDHEGVRLAPVETHDDSRHPLMFSAVRDLPAGHPA